MNVANFYINIIYFIPDGNYGLVPFFFGNAISCTYWFNSYAGLIVNLTLFGDLYINFGDRAPYFPLLQPGIGIRCSYNGKGGNNRSNDICYSGGLMISVPWIGICDENGDRCFLIGSRGVRVELTP